MVMHHPDESILIEYAAGVLDKGISIAVSTHLQFCPQCCHTVAKLNQVGGEILESCSKKTLTSGALDRLMTRIHEADLTEESSNQNEAAHSSQKVENSESPPALPKLINKLIDQSSPIQWRTIWPSLQAAKLTSGQNQYEISLHKIRSGGSVPEHDHRGTEITVILEGSFSDAEGVYNVGDFVVRQPGDIHRPIATQNQDCLCLSIVEAPSVLTGFLGWLINPFLSVRPA